MQSSTPRAMQLACFTISRASNTARHTASVVLSTVQNAVRAMGSPSLVFVTVVLSERIICGQMLVLERAHTSRLIAPWQPSPVRRAAALGQ